VGGGAEGAGQAARLHDYVSYGQECFMNVYGRVKSITSRRRASVYCRSGRNSEESRT